MTERRVHGWGVWFMVTCAWLAPVLAQAESAVQIETVVFVRHGEKPAESLGQLTCQGLNRALALAPVLVGKYGRPDYIFAPDPKQDPGDPHHSRYDYVRPLATIEPVAIQLGMPVNTQFNTATSADLAKELDKPAYHQATVFVAWEHKLAEEMAGSLMMQWGGRSQEVPHWAGEDYDSIYVIQAKRSAGQVSVTFRRDAEGLDGQSKLCPAQQSEKQVTKAP